MVNSHLHPFHLSDVSPVVGAIQNTKKIMFDDASEKWVLVWRYKYIFEIQIQNTECCDAGFGRRVGPLDGGDHSLRLQVEP